MVVYVARGWLLLVIWEPTMDRPAVEGRTAAVRDMICLDRSSRALRATTEPPLFGRRFFFLRFGEVVRVDSMVGLLDRYVDAGGTLS